MSLPSDWLYRRASWYRLPLRLWCKESRSITFQALPFDECCARYLGRKDLITDQTPAWPSHFRAFGVLAFASHFTTKWWPCGGVLKCHCIWCLLPRQTPHTYLVEEWKHHLAPDDVRLVRAAVKLAAYQHGTFFFSNNYLDK